MTEKPFFEVFRTLEVDNQTRALFEQVVVTRVSTSPFQDVLRVYITSKKLIAKNQLFHLAKQIQRQIFGYRKVQVLIFEKFQLSSQYTPQKLWSLYEDSVLTELEAYSPYKRSILKNAAVEFPDEENVLVGISSKVYDKDAVEDIIRILDRVFNERCGFRVKVDVEYREPKESVSMEKSEAELQQRISFLSENLRKEKAAKAEAKAEAKAAREEKKAEAAAAGKSAPAAEAGGGQKGGSSGNGGGFGGGRKGGSFGSGGSYRRSDNPDVLYGRDFEDEPIPLEQESVRSLQ